MTIRNDNSLLILILLKTFIAFSFYHEGARVEEECLIQYMEILFQ